MVQWNPRTTGGLKGLSALVCVTLLVGCAPSGPSGTTTQPPPPSPTRTTVSTAPGTTLALLHGLAVKGRAPKTGYSRDQFGAAWADADRNGCDQRNDVLRRDLTGCCPWTPRR